MIVIQFVLAVAQFLAHHELTANVGTDVAYIRRRLRKTAIR